MTLMGGITIVLQPNGDCRGISRCVVLEEICGPNQGALTAYIDVYYKTPGYRHTIRWLKQLKELFGSEVDFSFFDLMRRM